ncbi:MAG TPA: hypothetical protein VK894_09615 [Jiangellales bacterium]|nr:hypothetical protein [Jiangellales bacterium]
MRPITGTICTAAAAGALVLGMAGTAAAAQQPSGQGSCLAKIFQAQAVDAPRTVSDRILFIRDFELHGDPFGQALKPLARGTFEYCP